MNNSFRIKQLVDKQICGLLIASGFSGRMGRLKSLLDIGGASFITGISLKLSLVCDKVLVVLGYEKDLIEAGLNNELKQMENSDSSLLCAVAKRTANKLEIVYNDNYDKGMFTSLQMGINRIQEYSWVLYHFVDQPALPKSFYFKFVEKINSDCKWIQPVHEERSGHPLLLSGSVCEKIRDADKSDNLRNLLAASKAARCAWECPYPEVLDDIDTIEEYNNMIAGGYGIKEDLLS